MGTDKAGSGVWDCSFQEYARASLRKRCLSRDARGPWEAAPGHLREQRSRQRERQSQGTRGQAVRGTRCATGGRCGWRGVSLGASGRQRGLPSAPCGRGQGAGKPELVAMAPCGQAALQRVSFSSLGGFGLQGAGPLLSWGQRDRAASGRHGRGARACLWVLGRGGGRGLGKPGTCLPQGGPCLLTRGKHWNSPCLPG